MRKRILKNLICPNTGEPEFELFAVKLSRDGERLTQVNDKDIRDDDDIYEGIIANLKTNMTYPIYDSIGSLLSDEDADQKHYAELLTGVSKNCPADFQKAIKANLKRLTKAKVTNDGTWNREEMEYYDADVSSDELREKFLEKIRKKPLWHIFIERKRHLIEKSELKAGMDVLEIGCGNARTIAHISPPAEIGYNFTGIDISWKRMLLAKSVIPEGDFIQASALNLPFKSQSHDISIAFGSLHHLPNRKDGLMEAVRVTAPKGQILINEPIEKPQIISEEKFGWLRKRLEDYEHSEHDNDINLEEFHQIIKDEGLTLQHEYVNGSVLRTVLTLGFIKKIPVYSTRTWWRFLIWLDRIFITVFCRKHGMWGPSGAYLVLKKNG